MADKGDDEVPQLPRAALNKMIKELAPNVRVANDARELIAQCCTEFIHLLASEANDICAKQQKKTINPEHVLKALESLGFSEYIDEAQAVFEESKATQAQRKRMATKLADLGIPEEELLRTQQALFDQAKESLAKFEQQEWERVQSVVSQQLTETNNEDEDDYS